MNEAFQEEVAKRMFKDRFCVILDKSGKSIEDFAKMIGISRQSVGFYRDGKRVPDAGRLAQIAEQCNVSCDWLMGLVDDREIDVSVKAISEHTGLSSDSIQAICELGTTELALINGVLSSTHLQDVLDTAKEYVEFRQQTDSEMRFTYNIGSRQTEATITAGDISAAMRFSLIKKTEPLIEDAYQREWRQVYKKLNAYYAAAKTSGNTEEARNG